MADRCREIAAQFGSAHVGMNSNYFASISKSIDFVTIFGTLYGVDDIPEAFINVIKLYEGIFVHTIEKS